LERPSALAAPKQPPGFQVEIRTIPRTGDPGALNVAFQREELTPAGSGGSLAVPE